MAENPSRHSWNQAPLPFVCLTRDGLISEVNTLWEQLTGYSADDSIGRHVRDFVPAEHRSECDRNLELLMAKGTLDGSDCALLCRDGHTVDARVFCRLDDDGSCGECLLVDMTALHQTEDNLKESEARFRSLFELAPTPIVIHDGTAIVMANQAAASFLGYDTAADVIGLAVFDLVHPDDRAIVAERIRRMVEEGWVAPMRRERFMRRDGSVAYGDTLSSPVELGGKRAFHVVAIDLSKRMDVERELAEIQDQYRTLFENSGDAVIVHDGQTVRFANKAALASFGLAADPGIAGRKLLDFVHPDSISVARRRLDAFSAGEDEDRPTELHLLRADGSEWYAESLGVTLVIHGERLMQTTLRDLTERKRTEGELAGYREQLERLLAERTASLARARQELYAVTSVVSRTVEMRDPYTAGHQRRVTALALAIARELGLDDVDVEALDVAASMHDVGKVTVPAEILSKPSRLTDLEFELVKSHVEAGYSIVTSAELPEAVAQIVYQHHERLDGSGYPRGLTDDQLVLGARILAVADVVEAMCSHRPYRPSIGLTAAIAELDRGSGTVYDADVVEACEEVVRSGFAFAEEF